MNKTPLSIEQDLLARLRSGDYIVLLVDNQVVFKAGDTAVVDSELQRSISRNLDAIEDALSAASDLLDRISASFSGNVSKWKKLHDSLTHSWPDKNPWEYMAWSRLIAWSGANLKHAYSLEEKPKARRKNDSPSAGYHNAWISFSARQIPWAKERLLGSIVTWPMISDRLEKILKLRG